MAITQRALLQLGISHGVQVFQEDNSFTASFFLPRHEGFNGDSKYCSDCAVNTASEKVYNYLKGLHLLPMGTLTPLRNVVCNAAIKSAVEEVSKF